MADFQIGGFDFVALSQLPPNRKQQVLLETRAGVDGQAIWFTGKRGAPFQTSSFRDVQNVTIGTQLISAYQALVGQIVSVRFAGVFMVNQYLVLDVVPVPEGVRKILLGVGGLEGTSGAVVEANWTLLAV